MHLIFSKAIFIGACCFSLLGFSNNYSSNEDLEKFLQIPLTEENMSDIRNIFETYLNRDIDSLLEDQNYLWQIKKKTESIHMLRAIGFIITDPEMKLFVNQLKNAGIKFNYLLIGLEIEMGNLKCIDISQEELSGFAKYSNLDITFIQKCLDKNLHKELVDYILNSSAT